MRTFADLIEQFGGAAKMAAAIDQPANTIRQWSVRGSIPARYWASIVAAATDRNIEGVTFAALGVLAAGIAPPASEGASAAASGRG